jgi:hypothetical protein
MALKNFDKLEIPKVLELQRKLCYTVTHTFGGTCSYITYGHTAKEL